MHSVTLRMDRVFDIQADAFSGDTRRTLFSFESNGKRYFSVLVNGDPQLESGQTITAILKRPDNWQTVMGLRVHETGEVCAPSTGVHMGLLLLTAFAATVSALELHFSHPGALAPVLAAHGVAAACFIYNAIVTTKIRRALLVADGAVAR
jgi:hypothetical protein